jgi:hypothetical protein
MPAAPPPAPAAQIAVFTPVAGQGPALDTLKAVLHLRPDVIKIQSRSRVVALVHVDNRVYNADLQPRSYGYHLSLRLVTAVPPAPALAPSFDAVGYANTFLNARGLGGAYQNPAITQSTSTITVALTQQSGSYALSGAQAALTFDTRGVLLSVDVRWVDTTSAPLANSITPDAALQEVAAGHGLISIGGGVVPDSNSSVTGTTIVYVAVNAPDGTYYEPVYQFTCVTGGGVPFQVYVPAIERIYLR